MNQYLEYETILKGQIGASVFALIMAVALAVMFFVLNIKFFSQDFGKISRTLINMFIIAAILGATIFFSLRIHHLNQDIQSQSYVTYHGEFNVSEYNDGYVTFKDQDETITLSGRCDLPGGKYVGTVIYSELSKHLLDWEVNTD